jgi:uncharacterized protein YebE (UPF0316 family)
MVIAFFVFLSENEMSRSRLESLFHHHDTSIGGCFMLHFNQQVLDLILLPSLILISRIVDVSISTIRIIFLSRGYKLMSALLGFLETFVWIVAINRLMSSDGGIIVYFSYASGFAAGIYIGMKIEEKLALGYLLVRVIIPKQETRLLEKLRAQNFGVTVVDAKGASGYVMLLYTVIKRKNIDWVTSIIKEEEPQAFYSVEDVRNASSGIFPQRCTLSGDSKYIK